MKITIYTTTDCQFSKQEKEYLVSHNLPFEEKNLETNREYLTEMLVLSNNFAGTPVTKVEQDNGSITVLKGFTKEEFDTTFGFGAPAQPAVTNTAPVENNVPEVVAPVTISPAEPPARPVVETPVAPVAEPPAPIETPVVPPPPVVNEPVAPVIPEIIAPMETPVKEESFTTSSSNEDSLPPAPVVEAPLSAAPAAPLEIPSIDEAISDLSRNQSQNMAPVEPPAPRVVETPSAPSIDPVAPPVVETTPKVESTNSAQQDAALDSILNSLKSKVAEATPPTQNTQQMSGPDTNTQ